MEKYPFNVRVYGALIHEGHLLVSDEDIDGWKITKLPGGGLEFGEGTRQCLRREFMEEANLEIEIGEHLYTTDFFQPSAFNAKIQVLSIYYYVKSKELDKLKLASRPFQFDHNHQNAQAFRLISLEKLSEQDFSLPIDKQVARMLINSK